MLLIDRARLLVDRLLLDRIRLLVDWIRLRLKCRIEDICERICSLCTGLGEVIGKERIGLLEWILMLRVWLCKLGLLWMLEVELRAKRGELIVAMKMRLLLGLRLGKICKHLLKLIEFLMLMYMLHIARVWLPSEGVPEDVIKDIRRLLLLFLFFLVGKDLVERRIISVGRVCVLLSELVFGQLVDWLDWLFIYGNYRLIVVRRL